MSRTVGIVLLSTVLGCLFGFLVGLVLDAVSPSFADLLLHTEESQTPGSRHTPGLNRALGLANGAWMGFVLGVLSVVLEAYLKVKRNDRNESV